MFCVARACADAATAAGWQGHVIQLQGDQRKNVSTFLIAVRRALEAAAATQRAQVLYMRERNESARLTRRCLGCA